MSKILSIILVALMIPVAAFAGSRNDLYYQGLLFDAEENAVSGTLHVTFRLYEEAEEGEPLWEETQSIVIDRGVYSVPLGSVESFPSGLFEQGSLYLGIQIEGDVEMSPRIGLYSVPFAQQAEVAATAMSLAEGIVTADAIALEAVTTASIADGTIADTDISAAAAIADTKLATISTAGKVADSALSSNVSLLGQTIESSEVTDGTLVNVDLSASAAIAGTKIDPNFGTQNVTTSGNISTTGSGTITAAGDIAAAGGFKTMIGPFQETNVAANTAKAWEMIEGSGPDEIPMPWAGSVMGVSLKCVPGTGVTAGTLTVEPTIDGAETNLEITLTSASGSNKQGTASQAKDLDVFNANQTIGCKATSSSDFLPTTLDCACLVFVEM